jgi:hypothetical protein
MRGNRLIASTSLVVVALATALFAALAWWSATHNSATYDEPLHLVAAQLITQRDDYRYNSEDPALWHRWAALPVNGQSLNLFDHTAMQRDGVEDNYVRWAYVTSVLFLGKDSAGKEIDGHAVLMRARAAMLFIGISVVVLAAAAAWVLAGKRSGPIAAIITAIFIAFDPTLLGHAALVKNDLAMSLVYLAVALAAYLTGQKLTAGRLLFMLLAVAVAPCIKFSGLLIAPVLILLLAVRSLIPAPWHYNLFTKRGELTTRPARIAAAAAITLAAAAMTFAMIWATYGFRYAPSRDGTLDVPKQLAAVKYAVAFEQVGTRLPTQAEADSARVPLAPAIIYWMDQHQLLPQAWSHGFLFTYHTSKSRVSYLLGNVSNFGWWYYFPLALLFKTPLATLALWLASAIAAIVAVVKHRSALPWWAACCLLIPAGMYLASAMTTNMNIGIRHIMPLLPLLYVMAGCVAAATIAAHTGRHRAMIAAAVAFLAALTAAEVLRKAPQFLPFFNEPSTRADPRMLLGDSNLDWGQDLHRLAHWQAAEKDGALAGRRLLLAYFGSAIPSKYGVDAKLLPGSSMLLTGENPDFRSIIGTEPAIIAVSSTILQGIYIPENIRKFYWRVMELPPVGQVGSSIYLYEYGKARKPATTPPATQPATHPIAPPAN